MEPTFLFIKSQFILIPVVIGLLRFKLVKKGYLLLYLDILCGFLTEVISYILIRKHLPNAVPTNIFVLFEWILLALQFRQWGFLAKKDRLFYVFLVFPIVVWIIENIAFRKIFEFSPYFRILYSFLVVIMSVTKLNFDITHGNKNLFRNPIFIVCISFIVYFTYQIVYEWAYQLSLMGRAGFTLDVSALFSYINALNNIALGIAFFIIPKERKFELK